MGYESLLLLGIAGLFAYLYTMQDIEKESHERAIVFKGIYFTVSLLFVLAALIWNYNISQTVCTNSPSTTWTCAYTYSGSIVNLGPLMAPTVILFFVLIILHILWLIYSMKNYPVEAVRMMSNKRRP